MSFEKFLSQLERMLPIQRNEPMARHSTFHIGGPAQAYVKVQRCGELQAVAALVHQWRVPVFLLGAGSNLLVGDKGIPGLVIKTWANKGLPPHVLRAQEQEAPGTVLVWAFCGMPLPRLAYQTARAGLAGLEWAVGVPGTVGGGVVNNAGAHGGALADVVRSVMVLGAEGHQVFTNQELSFGYRASNFRGPWAEVMPPPVILAAELQLQPASPEILETHIAQYLAHRRATQPSQRSIGSIFKNPEGYAAGWLIEQAGLKGRRVGDAQISTKHGNFIVNRGHAAAAEVNQLINLAQSRVKEAFGIQMELEIQRAGEGF